MPAYDRGRPDDLDACRGFGDSFESRNRSSRSARPRRPLFVRCAAGPQVDGAGRGLNLKVARRRRPSAEGHDESDEHGDHAAAQGTSLWPVTQMPQRYRVSGRDNPSLVAVHKYNLLVAYSRRPERGRVRRGARARRPAKASMQSSADPDFANRRPMPSNQNGTFNAQAFLDSAGVARRIVEYRRADVIFSQGDPCESVLYIQTGGVKISVLSKTGKQAVVAMLGPGDFFGEGGLAGQPVRMGSATASTSTTILVVDQHEMVRVLHQQRAMSDLFIAHLLKRTIRIEEDLVDQLFSPSEKRLARKLLLLARYGEHDKPVRTIPAISQETLAEMVGTTRSRVNFFMKKFQRLGFIDYTDGLKVNNSLLTVVLHE
jgi:CRP/FNR family cyclic AMP-dependent transcriptional regulator